MRVKRERDARPSLLISLCSPTYSLREALGEMLGSDMEKATTFSLAKDGSGVGGECSH
jgi:hypothetical protein